MVFGRVGEVVGGFLCLFLLVLGSVILVLVNGVKYVLYWDYRFIMLLCEFLVIVGCCIIMIVYVLDVLV